MSVHQLKDGRWIVRYPKGTMPEQPNRTREYFGRGIEAEAAARQRNEEVRLSHYRRQAPTRKSPQFFELADAYLQNKDFPTASKVNLFYKLDRVILPEIGHIQAMRLTSLRLNQYRF